MSHLVKVRLRDGAVTPLANGSNGWSVYHISTRSLVRPEWVHVSWFEVDQRITAVKLDASGSVERLRHIHSATSGCYVCEAHPAPSPDRKWVVLASNWAQDCGAA